MIFPSLSQKSGRAAGAFRWLCRFFYSNLLLAFCLDRLHTEDEVDEVAEPHNSENSAGNVERFSQHQEKADGHQAASRTSGCLPWSARSCPFSSRMSRGVFDRALCRETMCAAFPTSLQSRTPSQGRTAPWAAPAARCRRSRAQAHAAEDAGRKASFSFIGFLSPVSFFRALSSPRGGLRRRGDRKSSAGRKSASRRGSFHACQVCSSARGS